MIMVRPAFSEQENDAIRRTLVDGALELFRQVEPEELSLRKLADHLRMSHTKMYRYFDNKNSLLAAVKIRSLETLHQFLSENDPVEADPVTRLHAASSALFNFCTEHRKEYLFLFSEANTADEIAELIQLRHKVFNYIVEIAKIAHTEGYTTLDGRTLAHLSWATLHGLFLLNFGGQLMEGRTFEELLESAAEHLFGKIAT